MPYKNKVKQRDYNKKWRSENREYDLKRQRESHQRRRLLVLNHYGKGKPSCVCCKEIIIEFLSLDHINGGGTQHRKKVGSGTAFYLWIIRNNFPKGFQVLCHNCNQAIGFYGDCPHKSIVIDYKK